MVGGVSDVAMKMLQSLLSQSMQQVMDQFWTARRRASQNNISALLSHVGALTQPDLAARRTVGFHDLSVTI